MTGWADTRALMRLAGRDRITVDGIDVTYLRGFVTPFPRYSLIEPFAYGPTSIQFPQVDAAHEADQFGQPGDLSWARQGAKVVISRTFATDPEKIDYVGRVSSVEAAGRVLNLDVGGEFAGPANTLQQQNQMFRYNNDAGHWAALAVAAVNLHFTPWFGPVTGIRLTHTGGQSHLAWVQYVGAMSQDDAGIQRALMPTAWGSDTWQFEPKDYTTVHGTIFNDDTRVVLQVVKDITEAPNAIYGTGITPDGERITNAKWPGVFYGPAPAYPIAGGSSFGIGTTDADTVTGDGISVGLYSKLVNMGYIPFTTPPTSTYDTTTAAGVKKLQAKAGLSQTGTMTVAAWNALFDNDVTGYSINGAYIAPLAEDTRVREFDRTSNGSIIRRNPDFDSTVQRVEVTKDYGAGMTKAAMIDNARGILARAATYKNWAGTVRLEGFGAFAGDQTGVDVATLTEADMIPHRDIRPGQNYVFPYFDGGTVFHVSGADPDATGVTLTVDTQARDLVEVREILARNADSRRSPTREWMVANANRKPSSSMIACDEGFGWIDRDRKLDGGRWNVFPVIGGQQGQVNRVDVRLVKNKPEFAMAVFSVHVTPQELQHRFGNPMTTGGQSVWETSSSAQEWIDSKKILYAVGDGKQPCGYYPKRKLDDNNTATGAPITGRHLDDAPWPYIHAAHTAVIEYVAIYPDRDCTLKKGRILYPQLNDAAA